MIEEPLRSQPQVQETTFCSQLHNLIKAFEMLKKQVKTSQQARESNPLNLSSRHAATKLLNFNPSDIPFESRSEQTMRAFWQLLDEAYFRPIEEQDIQPVEAILNQTKRYLIGTPLET